MYRFHCIDELWDAIDIGEEGLRQLWDIDDIDCMESWKKLNKMVKKFEGRDVCIKRIWVFELLLPCLVDDFHDKVIACRVRRFVESTVISPGLVFSFGLVDFCSHRVPVSCGII